MNESSAPDRKALTDRLPRRDPGGGTILGRPDPVSELAEHRLGIAATRAMPRVELTAQVMAPVTDQGPWRPSGIEDIPLDAVQPGTRTWGFEVAADMRRAADVLEANGLAPDSYWDFAQQKAGTPVEDCRVTLFGALSIAVTGRPAYTLDATTKHERALSEYLELTSSSALWTWAHRRGLAELTAALRACADILDPPQVDEPPHPEVPAEPDPRRTEQDGETETGEPTETPEPQTRPADAPDRQLDDNTGSIT